MLDRLATEKVFILVALSPIVSVILSTIRIYSVIYLTVYLPPRQYNISN